MFLGAALKHAVGSDALLKEHGRVVFLLDGVNEIHSSYYGPFLMSWQRQRSRFPSLFTCRAGEEPWNRGDPKGEAMPLDSWLEVEELDDTGLEQFVEVYVREKRAEESLPHADRRRLWEAARGVHFSSEDLAIEVNDLLKRGLLEEGGIGRNPYWLRMMVQRELRTPNQGELFHAFAKALIEREVDPKRQERKRQPLWKTMVPLEVEMDALANLAWAMHSKGVVGFQGDQWWKHGEQAIEHAIPENRGVTVYDVLCEGEAATLIRWQYKERIAFTHQLLQEFFAAYALRHESKWPEVSECADDLKKWRVLFLLSGLLEHPQAAGSADSWSWLVKRLSSSLHDWPRRFALIVALLALECQDTVLLKNRAYELASSLEWPILGSELEAAHELVSIAGDRAVELFTELLDSKELGHRLKGVHLLRMARTKRGANALISELREKRRSARRRGILDAIKRIDKPTLELLVKAIEDQGWKVSSMDAGALEYWIETLEECKGWRDPEQREMYGQLLTEFLIPELCDTYCRAVGNALALMGETAFTPLIDALKDKDQVLREAVADVLEEMTHIWQASHAREWKGYVLAVDFLVDILKDDYSGVGWAAAKVLGWTGETQAVMGLIDAVDGQNQRFRMAAREALVRIGEPAVEPLIAMLRHGRWREAVGAAAMLGEIGNARAVSQLIAALEHEDRDVRIVARKALRKLGLDSK
jgi:HEAT repeat protein